MGKFSYTNSMLITLLITLCCSWSLAFSQTKDNSAPILKRIMLMKFKAEATQAKIDSVHNYFLALAEKIPGMLSAEWGTDINFSRDKQYTYCITLSYISEEAYAIYDQHPDHQALKNTANGFIENFFLIEYWTGKDSSNMAEPATVETTQK